MKALEPARTMPEIDEICPASAISDELAWSAA
jgi:hypothetical protein